MTRIEREIQQYPETGIINPFVCTKFMLTQEMIDFFNSYLLTYRDYPDKKIAQEFAVRFEIDRFSAKSIEHDYVVINRARIYKRIENLLRKGMTKNEVAEQITLDFGFDITNAEKYVTRFTIDSMDSISGAYVEN